MLGQDSQSQAYLWNSCRYFTEWWNSYYFVKMQSNNNPIYSVWFNVTNSNGLFELFQIQKTQHTTSKKNYIPIIIRILVKYSVWPSPKHVFHLFCLISLRMQPNIIHCLESNPVHCHKIWLAGRGYKCQNRHQTNCQLNFNKSQSRPHPICPMCSHMPQCTISDYHNMIRTLQPHTKQILFRL